MLDYAANAPIAWSPGSLRAMFESRCTRERLDPAAALRQAIGEGTSPEAFWQSVDENLLARHLRLLFVTDRMLPELRRIVEFLNQSMSEVEVLAVELRRYSRGPSATFVPAT